MEIYALLLGNAIYHWGLLVKCIKYWKLARIRWNVRYSGGILAKCKEISRFARNVWYRADLANVTWNVCPKAVYAANKGFAPIPWKNAAWNYI
jgi:hypothetical protein